MGREIENSSSFSYVDLTPTSELKDKLQGVIDEQTAQLVKEGRRTISRNNHGRPIVINI